MERKALIFNSWENRPRQVNWFKWSDSLRERLRWGTFVSCWVLCSFCHSLLPNTTSWDPPDCSSIENIPPHGKILLIKKEGRYLCITAVVVTVEYISEKQYVTRGEKYLWGENTTCKSSKLYYILLTAENREWRIMRPNSFLVGRTNCQLLGDRLCMHHLHLGDC